MRNSQQPTLSMKMNTHPSPDSAPARSGICQTAAVVLNYRTPVDTITAVASLRASNRKLDQIIVVDNDSGDGSEEQLRTALPDVTIIQTGQNLGYSGGNNAGIREALARGCDLVLILNSDVTVAPDCIARLEEALCADQRLGLVGPVILSRDAPHRIDSSGMSFSPNTGRMRHPEHGKRYDSASFPPVRVVDGLMGCAVLVKRVVFEAAGLLAEEYFFSLEDLEFSLRARASGYESACIGAALAYHRGSASIGARSSRRLYYATRNHLLLAARAAPLHPLKSLARTGSIVTLNAAHAVISDYRSLAGLRAVARGAADYFRGRFGQAP